MNEDMHCKLFVDSELEKSDLAAAIAAATHGVIKIRSVHSDWGVIDVLRNDEHDSQRKLAVPDGFLFFRYLLDVEPGSGISREDYIARLKELITFLKDRHCRVVAACEFEDELPSSDRSVESGNP